MKVYGVDFTSAPSQKKPITCARCKLSEEGLSLERLDPLASFEEFEHFLRQPGPWIAGLDFPFGQPHKLIDNLGWPETWEGYVRHISTMTRTEFIDGLAGYCQSRPQGDRHHLRLTDKLAGSRSPMMLYRVPVGKMFFEGSPRLLEAGVTVLPCHIQDNLRLVAEAYPALVARRWIDSRSYKTDTLKEQTPSRQSAREEIVRALRSGNVRAHFGFDVRFDDEAANVFVRDGSGDWLDALLCAVQAGWAYVQRERNFGIPVDCDPLEGWIVDPGLVSKEGKIKPL